MRFAWLIPSSHETLGRVVDVFVDQIRQAEHYEGPLHEAIRLLLTPDRSLGAAFELACEQCDAWFLLALYRSQTGRNPPPPLRIHHDARLRRSLERARHGLELTVRVLPAPKACLGCRLPEGRNGRSSRR